MKVKVKELYETINRLLNDRLRPYAGRDLNLVTCVEVYTTIFDTWRELVEQTKAGLSNEGLNYLAQAYYDAVAINGRQQLDPEIFSQRARLTNISTKELTTMAVLSAGSDISAEIIAEVKKRS